MKYLISLVLLFLVIESNSQSISGSWISSNTNNVRFYLEFGENKVVTTLLIDGFSDDVNIAEYAVSNDTIRVYSSSTNIISPLEFSASGQEMQIGDTKYFRVNRHSFYRNSAKMIIK